MHKIYTNLKGFNEYIFITRSYSDLVLYTTYLPYGHGERGDPFGDGELYNIEDCSIYNLGSFEEAPEVRLEFDYA